MTHREFLDSWAVLTAALGFTAGAAQKTLYEQRLAGLPDDALRRGVADLVESPAFAELVQYRRLPTLHELRAACREAEMAPRGRPYVGGVPLRDVLESIPTDSREPLPEEAGDLVGRVAARARALPAKVLPGPGNTGHRALARIPVAPVPASRLTDDEWEVRRRRLLEQGDQAGTGERVS